MTKGFVKSLLCSVALLSAVSSAAVSATMNYLGSWGNTTTYATGSVIVYNKGIYYSLKSTNSAPNRNFIPSSNPTWWAPVGTVGNTILNGLVNPTSAGLGQVGDYYINTASNTIFGPKTANGWPASGISLVGPKGDTGAQGVPGIQGAQGAQGQQGIQGVKGDAGATGATGPSGTSGLANATCSSGYVIGFDANANIVCSYNQSTYQKLPSNGMTPDQIRSAALGMSSGRNHCYLANITTQTEMDYIQTNELGGGSDLMFVGGRRDGNDTNTWYWSDGPEAGTVFWKDGAAVGNNFPGWDPQNRTETWTNAIYTAINSYYRPYMSGAYGDAPAYLVECTYY